MSVIAPTPRHSLPRIIFATLALWDLFLELLVIGSTSRPPLCGMGGPDSSLNNPPWFYKQLPSPTSDTIEMRVCVDENRDNEDIKLPCQVWRYMCSSFVELEVNYMYFPH